MATGCFFFFHYTFIPDLNYRSTVGEMKLWMLDGENKHLSCEEDKVGWAQQGIDFPLRKSGVRANCSVNLTGPYRPIIYKTEGYHNCLLNNSIKQWRPNLCLGSKLSNALDAEIEKISAATPTIYFFTAEITNTNKAVIAGHMRLIQSKGIVWDWISAESVGGRVLVIVHCEVYFSFLCRPSWCN